MSGEFLPDVWARTMDASLREMVGLPPDTRGDEEYRADQAKWEAGRPAREAASRAKQRALKAEHRARLAVADGLAKQILDLHGPVFGRDIDEIGKCGGCEFEPNWEGEAADFPCATYRLAATYAPSRTRAGAGFETDSTE